MQLTLIHAMRVTTTLTESLMKGHLKIACQGNNLTPELSLYLLSASCPLYSAPADDQHPLSSLSSDPWWSVYWPGGQVLARHILDNNYLVTNKRVLDVGSGCGAVTIASSLSGAHHVIANDIDENASVALNTNLKLNNMDISNGKLEFSGLNYLENHDGLIDIDTILIGDMFYDKEIGEAVINLCKKCRDLKKTVLLGDPGRWFLKSSSDVVGSMFECVAKYDLTEETKQENYGFDHGLVWKLRNK